MNTQAAEINQVFANSYSLHLVACFSYNKMATAKSDNSADKPQHALTAIVFSAASLEAFIHEVACFAGMVVRREFDVGNADVLKKFEAIIGELEDSQAQLRTKLLFLPVIFGAQAWDRGAQPFQDFGTLIDLRNAIMHMKPDVRLMNEKSKAKRLMDALGVRGMLSNDPGITGTSWLHLIGTRAAARWACQTAADIVDSIIELMPAGDFRDSLIRFERVQ